MIVAIMVRRKAARRTGFSLVELAVVLLIVAFLTGFLVVVIQKLRRIRDTRVWAPNLLKQMSLALQNCDNTYGSMPPACDKFGPVPFATSVHVHLLPFVEEEKLYESYRDAEGKGKVTEAIISAFLCRGDYSMTNNGKGVQNCAANLRVLSEKGFKTAYDTDMPPLAGIEAGSITVQQIARADGTSNTIAFATRLAECGEGGSRYAAAPDSKFAAFFGENAARIRARVVDTTATFQLAPDEIECRPTPLMGQSFTKERITISMLDGSVRSIASGMSPQVWNAAMQPNDGIELGWEWNQ